MYEDEELSDISGLQFLYTEGSKHPLLLLGFGVILTILLALIIIVLLIPSLLIKPHRNRNAKFFALFQYNLRCRYPCQTSETMVTLQMGVESILRPRPERPAVILMLSPSGTYLTACSLARCLARIVLSTFGRTAAHWVIKELHIEGTKYTAFDDHWVFYEKLSRLMHEWGVAIITDFEMLHPQVTTAFSHLADDTYAPFPQSLLVLVAHSGAQYGERSMKGVPAVILAEAFLEEQLGPLLDRNIMPELINRLTGRAIVVRSEDSLLTYLLTLRSSQDFDSDDFEVH